jgi:hypothetical protein
MSDKCPDCKGSGRVTLVVSVRPCATCAGSGRVAEHEKPVPTLNYTTELNPASEWSRWLGIVNDAYWLNDKSDLYWEIVGPSGLVEKFLPRHEDDDNRADAEREVAKLNKAVAAALEAPSP